MTSLLRTVERPATLIVLRCGVVLLFLSVGIVGCDRARARPGITCDKLRALRIGLAPSDVISILGEPPRPPYSEMSPGPSLIIWNYSNDSPFDGGVRLFLSFDRDRLVKVSSYVRTFWRDLRNSGPRPTTFRIDADSPRVEGREFVTLYCPERQD
jgi:hypothetical protein